MARNGEEERMRNHAANVTVDELAAEVEPNVPGQAEPSSEALPVPEDREQAREQMRAAVARRRKALDALAKL